MVNRMAGTVNHHSFRAGEFSAGEMGNFQVALTVQQLLPEAVGFHSFLARVSHAPIDHHPATHLPDEVDFCREPCFVMAGLM